MKKKFFFYKPYNGEMCLNHNTNALRFNFKNILKLCWSFNKKLLFKKAPRKLVLPKRICIKKKPLWHRWHVVCLKGVMHYQYQPIWRVVITNSLVDYLIFFKEIYQKLSISFKNLRLVRIKENTLLNIRKRFQTFYLYKTFEYAYHDY